MNLTDYQRVTFTEISESAVKDAIDNPRKIDMNLVYAQEARRILDRIIGYTVSPALSTAKAASGLSAGRVQSPAARLIIDMERKIKSFTKTDHFGVQITFDSWVANWDTTNYVNENAPYYLDLDAATRLSQIDNVKVIDFK